YAAMTPGTASRAYAASAWTVVAVLTKIHVEHFPARNDSASRRDLRLDYMMLHRRAPMKIKLFPIFSSFALLSLVAVTGCGAETAADESTATGADEEVAESEDALTGGADNNGYFVV